MQIKKQDDIKKFLPDININRIILQDILKWLNEKEIIVLLGARQVGKTTIIFQMINQIISGTASLNLDNFELHYFNLDFPGDKELVNEDYITELATGNQKKKIIFIDEMQRKENAGIFLKYLYDANLPIKLIVSGSSSLELKSKVTEALTGRKIVFNISPFNMLEIKDFLTKSLENNLSDKTFDGNDNRLSGEVLFKEAFNIYTQYGGYPSVVTTLENEKKILRLKEIFTSYIEKDIKSFLEIKNEDAFRNLITLLSASTGCLINMNEISNTLSIHRVTLDNYFYYLEQTFIIDRVRPFFKNARKEIVKSPRVFFYDIGFRNFAVNNFNRLDIREDRGFVFENFVYLILKEKVGQISRIHFWRTKAGAEVDFIIFKELKPIPIESKAKYFTRPEITLSLRSFIDAYNPDTAFVINLNLNEDIKLNGCVVRFMDIRSFEESFSF